jgi:hypothetical protein
MFNKSDMSIAMENASKEVQGKWTGVEEHQIHA